MIKNILAGVLILAIGAYVGWRVYNKPHKDMGASTADVLISAEDLFTAFESNEEVANETYLDKVIQVKGKVDRIDQSSSGPAKIVLASGDAMFGVQCEMDEQSQYDLTGLEKGDMIQMKCLCTGKLMDVVLVRCVLTEN